MNSGAGGRPVSDDGEQHPHVCGRVNAGKECGYLAYCPIGVCEAGSWGETLAEVGLEWRLLPSYAPAALWLNGPSRACGGSWGPCSAWSSRGSGRRRASVTSEGQRWGEGAAVWQPSVALCDPQQEGGQLQAHTQSLPVSPARRGLTQPALPTRLSEGGVGSPCYPHAGTSEKSTPIPESLLQNGAT